MIGAVACTIAAGPEDTWRVRLDGVGPVKIGMTLQELNSALHEKFKLPRDKEEQSCFFAEPRGHEAIAFMLEDGKVTRIDVYKPGVYTTARIQVTDSEAKTLRVYGPSMTVGQSQYGDDTGHYLTMKSSDGKSAIRFETENGKVERFYAGRWESVQYAEGCE